MGYNKDAFQPTPPQNFECTNRTIYGSNPHFEWDRPDQPTNTTLTYYLYRNEGEGYHQIGNTTSNEFTDMGAELDKFGNTTYYYVKAKGASSPLSAASNIVSINTDIASKPLPGSKDEKFEEMNQSAFENLLSLSIYPNPFNAEANILYVLNEDAQINTTIYNLRGQKISHLDSGYKSAGAYHYHFNGYSLPGGVYFVRFQINDQFQTMKFLLLK